MKEEEKDNKQTTYETVPMDDHAAKMYRLLQGMALRSNTKAEFQEKLAEKGLQIEDYKGTPGIKTWRFMSLRSMGLESSLKKWEQEKGHEKEDPSIGLE